MDRKDFLKHVGLGAAAIFMTPRLLGKNWTYSLSADAVVKQVLAAANQLGAVYADARVGSCTLYGNTSHGTIGEALELVKTELLGARICINNTWRIFLLHDISHQGIQQSLKQALTLPVQGLPEREHWLTAHFCQDDVHAFATTDSEIEGHLNMAAMRYGQRQAQPASTAEIQFCDLLTQH